MIILGNDPISHWFDPINKTVLGFDTSDKVIQNRSAIIKIASTFAGKDFSESFLAIFQTESNPFNRLTALEAFCSSINENDAAKFLEDATLDKHSLISNFAQRRLSTLRS